MTADLLKYIFLLLIGTSILNFFITLGMKSQTQNKEFNSLLIFWPCLILTIIAAAVLDANPTQMAFAYFFQMIPINIVAKIMCSHHGIKTYWKYIIGIQLLSMASTTTLMLYTQVGFTASMLPVCLSSTLPFMCPIWFTLVKNRKNSNWIEIGISILLLLGIIIHINYAFFRLDPFATNLGWSISIAQYQSLAILFPLLINSRLQERTNTDLELSFMEQNYQMTTQSKIHLEQEKLESHIFVKTISHDLATPLTVIKTYIDMFLSGKVAEENHIKIWERMKLNVHSAQNIIEQINGIISIKNQAEIISITPTCFKSCIEELRELFAMQLAEKQLVLEVNDSTNPDTRVLAEKGSLTNHVLANIMSNAIKFSYRNSQIQIHVEESEKFIILTVRDFGIGIKQEVSETAILQSRPGTEGEVGSGFGLMALSFFVRKYEGEFHVSSTSEMQGTLIKLKLLKA